MTISASIPSPCLLRMRLSPIQQVAPLVLAIIAVVSISGVGSADAIFALTPAVIMIGGVYWLVRSAHDCETSCATSTDDLTGLPNRSGFSSALQDHLTRNRSRPLAIGLISLDSFSTINDTHGYRVGDRVLRDLAVRLQRMAPEAFVAYLGCGKFGFLIQTEPLQARILTEAVRELATAPYQIADLRLRVGCSNNSHRPRDRLPRVSGLSPVAPGDARAIPGVDPVAESSPPSHTPAEGGCGNREVDLPSV